MRVNTLRAKATMRATTTLTVKATMRVNMLRAKATMTLRAKATMTLRAKLKVRNNESNDQFESNGESESKQVEPH